MSNSGDDGKMQKSERFKDHASTLRIPARVTQEGTVTRLQNQEKGFRCKSCLMGRGFVFELRDFIAISLPFTQ